MITCPLCLCPPNPVGKGSGWMGMQRLVPPTFPSTHRSTSENERSTMPPNKRGRWSNGPSGGHKSTAPRHSELGGAITGCEDSDASPCAGHVHVPRVCLCSPECLAIGHVSVIVCAGLRMPVSKVRCAGKSSNPKAGGLGLGPGLDLAARRREAPEPQVFALPGSTLFPAARSALVCNTSCLGH